MTVASPPNPDWLIDRVEMNLAFLTLHLRSGRQLTLPISWLPRLAEVNPLERRTYEIKEGGVKVCWPELGVELSARDVFKMEDPRDLSDQPVFHHGPPY